MVQTTSTLDNISFVVNSIDDIRFAQLERNLREHLRPYVPELIRVPDARSMAEGLNRGARLARGKWLVFCHDDITILSDNAPRVLMDAMSGCDMFGPCGTTRLVTGNWYDAGRPYTFGAVVARDLQRPGNFELQIFGRSENLLEPGAQALDGIWIACRRSLFDGLRGFDAMTYGDFVGYDIDFSFRAYLVGARVAISTELILFHDSHVGEFSPEKIGRWERAQRGFEANFARHLEHSPGVRGHETIALQCPEEAVQVAKRKAPAVVN